MASLFGFEITRKKKNLKSFAPPPNEDGAMDLSPSAGGAISTYLDMDGSFKNDIELINKYRAMANQPECDAAIDDVVNEAIVHADTEEDVVKLELSELGAPDNIKNKFYEAFDKINNLLQFNRKGYELFRKWYIDGRIYFHIIVDEEKKKQGIQELRYLDPRKIKKARETVKKPLNDGQGAEIVQKIEEFYVYNEKALDKGAGVSKAVKIKADSIAYVNSGIFESGKNSVVGYLHKAIKPLNQLRMMEDAMVIYRISRAPERRLFYIDVGNLPKAKAEQYLKDTMNKYRNKLVYNAETGEMKDSLKHMSMLEDFWLPRREGGRGTEISTLPGGQNLGEIEDIMFFQTKLYKALNVPPSRLESDSGFSLGRESEITRDELKFSKFVNRMKNKFADLFYQLLKTELILQGVLKDEDWTKIKDEIFIEYAEDSYYRESKNAEILLARLGSLDMVSQYAGRYFSMDYIKRIVMQMTDKEIKEMQKQIDAEVNDEVLAKDATVEWGGAGPGAMGAPDANIPGEGPAGTDYEQPPPPEPPIPPQNLPGNSPVKQSPNGKQPVPQAAQLSHDININKLFEEIIDTRGE